MKTILMLCAMLMLFFFVGCEPQRVVAPPVPPAMPLAPAIKPPAPIVEVDNKFNEARKSLIERGIIKSDTPVYRLGEAVAFGQGHSYYLDELLVFPDDKEIIFFFHQTERRPLSWAIEVTIGDSTRTIPGALIHRRERYYRSKHKMSDVLVRDGDFVAIVIPFFHNDRRDVFVVMYDEIEKVGK